MGGRKSRNRIAVITEFLQFFLSTITEFEAYHEGPTQNQLMKKIPSILLALVVLSSMTVGCQTTQNRAEGGSGGISGEDTGFNRQSIYEMQDRTFRQLAY